MSNAICFLKDFIMADNIVDIHLIYNIHNIYYHASTDNLEATYPIAKMYKNICQKCFHTHSSHKI